MSHKSIHSEINRISDKNKPSRSRYMKSVLYASTIGALKKGQVPIVDPLIIRPLHDVYSRAIGKNPELVKEGRRADERKIAELADRVKKFTLGRKGGKRANKTRKNYSRKNRK